MKQEPYDEASARREFKRSTKLQAEFGDESTYLAYCRGAASGRITPPHNSVVVTEPDRVTTRPATRVAAVCAPNR